jgi:CDP-glucose 4,6-dehydratase
MMSNQLHFGGKRVLITGHSGFSGVWLCSLMSTLEASILGYSRDDTDFSTVFPKGSIDKKWPTFFGDVEDFETLNQQVLFFQPHLVIHLAAQATVTKGFEDPVGTFKTNCQGTVNVLQASLSSGEIQGVLVVTTDKVYLESSEIKNEGSTLGGSDPYSCSKVAAEQAVSAYRASYKNAKVPLCVVRGGNIVGGGDWSRNRLVPDVIRAVSNGENLVIRNPSATRPWQHVLDLVYSYSLISWHMLRSPLDLTNTEFNVGPDSQIQHTVADIVRLFQKKGLVESVNVEQSPNHEAETLSIDSTKISLTLGWNPVLQTLETIDWTASWYDSVLDKGLDPYEVTAFQVQNFLRKKVGV